MLRSLMDIQDISYAPSQPRPVYLIMEYVYFQKASFCLTDRILALLNGFRLCEGNYGITCVV